jgi:Spy/CpxP family protein refolding chaperone
MILFEESMISRCAEIKIQELHLASYIRSEKIDRNEVKKLIREINKNKTTLSIAYLNYLLDIKSILTPTQIDKLKQIKNRLRQKKRNEIRQHRENEIHPGVMDPDHT